MSAYSPRNTIFQFTQSLIDSVRVDAKTPLPIGKFCSVGAAQVAERARFFDDLPQSRALGSATGVACSLLSDLAQGMAEIELGRIQTDTKGGNPIIPTLIEIWARGQALRALLLELIELDFGHVPTERVQALKDARRELRVQCMAGLARIGVDPSPILAFQALGD